MNENQHRKLLCAQSNTKGCERRSVQPGAGRELHTRSVPHFAALGL